MISRIGSFGVAALSLSFACSDAREPAAQVGLSIDNPAQLVIRQIYGGGSNTGASWANDFVELFNRSAEPIALEGWSLQYSSATGTGNFGATTAQLTELPAVTLLPGQSYLVQEAGSGAAGSPLPNPDFVDPSPINLSASAGKLALVRTATSLGCNGSSNACSVEADALIVDLVGYGNANYAEGAPAASPDNATSLSRKGGGCTDTNRNASDFAVGAAEPRNSASPTVVCESSPGSGGAGGGPNASGGDSNSDNGGTSAMGGFLGLGGEAGAAAAGGTDTGAPQPGALRIHDIQGRAHRSPLEGTVVMRVPGVVTRVTGNGYYLQDPVPDSDLATSEGIFVFTSGKPNVALGDSLLVTSQVTEYRPGCSNCSASSSAYSNLSTTELDRPSEVLLRSSGNILPDPISIGPGGRMPPSSVIDAGGTADVESPLAQFSPDTDGIDFYESLEGMLVEVTDAIAVGPTNTNGELPVLAADGAGASLRSVRGGIVVRDNDFNPERIILSGSELPKANVGDHLPGVLRAIVDYSFGNYKFLVESPLPILVSGGIARESTTLGAKAPNELDVASVNLENLDPGDPDAKFAALADIIVARLGAPDLLSLEEVQDDNGATNDGTVTAAGTLAKLFDAVAAAGGPAYRSCSIDPLDGQDGGEPGGNIRVVLAYRTDRGLSFVERQGANATTPNAVVTTGDRPELAFNPGRIDPTNSAFANSRKPLSAEFSFNGQPLFVLANHFNSKGGDQPVFGRFQPPTLSSEVQRVAQARVVAGFVQAITSIEPNANVIALGDLNDFEFSPPLVELESVGLTSLVRSMPPEERYTYVYEGNSQVLDHVLASKAMLTSLKGFDIVHVNAEFAEQSSDHDPAVARFALGNLPTLGVMPILECVERLSGGLLRAHFGYDNPNALSVTRTIGAANRLLPSPADRGQPTQFIPGRQRDVWSLPFKGALLAWWLDRRVALATPFSPRCP